MTLEQLAASIAPLPDTAALTLSVAELRGLLVSGIGSDDCPLSAAEVGALPQVRRTAQTIRRWQKLHPFEGAYRDLAGAWRFPPEAVRHILSWNRAGGPNALRSENVIEPARTTTPNPTPPSATVPDDADDNLGNWRTKR